MSGRLVHEIIERARDHVPILFWVSSLNLIQRHIFKSNFLFKKGGISQLFIEKVKIVLCIHWRFTPVGCLVSSTVWFHRHSVN